MFRLYYQIEIRDKNGNLRRKGRRRVSKSFVANYHKILSSGLRSSNTSVTDTGGSGRTILRPLSTTGANPWMGGVGAATNNDGAGVIVGTGTTAVVMDEIAMETAIADGAGSGQLQYGAVSWSAPDADGTGWSFDVIRSFANQSGGTVNITEAGIVCETQYTTSSPFFQEFLLVRDVFAAVEVLNGETATVTYTVKVDV